MRFYLINQLGPRAAGPQLLCDRWLRSSDLSTKGWVGYVCISSPINKDSLFRWFFTDRQNHCETFRNAYGEFPVDFFFERNHGKNIQLAVCTGTNGTDISFDCGIHWMPLSFERGFNACTWGCEHLVLVGNSGKVRMMSLKDIVSQFKSIHPSNPTRN